MGTVDREVVVVGAGSGGIYAAHRFTQAGYSVLGVDGGSTFGGVWFHNRYPGSRVDTDSIDYSFHFDEDLYRDWQWRERYEAAPRILEYLNYVADRCDVRRLFRFDTWVTDACWDPGHGRWRVRTDTGLDVTCRYLLMSTGVLSAPKVPDFPGLSSFAGEWYQASRWPADGVDFRGKRVAVVGTGSSGVQAIPVIARDAEHVHVFQRHPHYAVPARNRPLDGSEQARIADDLVTERERKLGSVTRPRGLPEPRPVASHPPDVVEAILRRQWEFGGHGFSYLFSDQAVDRAANDVVAQFVRERIRERVTDPAVAAKLCPDYPIGTRRLILEMDYYECFNRPNVSLVDLLDEERIEEITPTGIRTDADRYEVDVIVFALGFVAFKGALDRAGIRTADGLLPSQVWAHGPHTVFGLMTPGFPNLFHPTNAGSPSVLGNAMLQHEFLDDWIVAALDHAHANGHAVIEATDDGATAWDAIVAGYAENLLRRQENQYMVHVNDDGSRVFMPFAAGMGRFVDLVRTWTDAGYRGFEFS